MPSQFYWPQLEVLRAYITDHGQEVAQWEHCGANPGYLSPNLKACVLNPSAATVHSGPSLTPTPPSTLSLRYLTVESKALTFPVFHCSSPWAIGNSDFPSQLSACLKNGLHSAYFYIPQEAFGCSEAICSHGADGLQAWGEGTCNLIGSLVMSVFLCIWQCAPWPEQNY